MALNKTGLKAAIKTVMTDTLAKEENSIDEFATRLSDAIETFVKSGTVTVTVTTTGSATAQSGTGTGSIN